MHPLVTIITPTFRPWDRLLAQMEALKTQTVHDFEWVVVDDLWDRRPFTLEADFPIIHVPPYHGVSEYDAGSHAVNTGLVYAQGRLVHFMNDYVLLSPRVLERHWAIYTEYGPRCFISGPRVPCEGQPEVDKRVRRGNPATRLTPGVGEYDAHYYFSAGVNDSAPLDALLRLGGVNEGWDGGHGPSDFDLALRLMFAGCRYMADLEAPAWEYPHTPVHSEHHWQKKRRTSVYDVFGITVVPLFEDYAARRRDVVLRENAWIEQARRRVCVSS